MTTDNMISLVIFALTLALTFAAALLARRHAQTGGAEEDLAGRKLNKWLIGLSAGTTGNSGFIVTGAVGLGYAGGLHWIFLPLSVMLGDLVFWSLFPARLNQFSQKTKAVTLSEILRFDVPRGFARAITVIVTLLVITCLSGYASGQWLAAKKLLSGAAHISNLWATVIFALTIISYSSIGGFRGSVYTDALQAFVRLLGTGIALGAVIWIATADRTGFSNNLAAAGTDFLTAFPGETMLAIFGFVLGFSGLGLCFQLGQPQIVARYLAGRDPAETKSAWWIYIGFVQLTWIAMTVFGILLRGVMPNLNDPESGLGIFFQQRMGPVLTGIIIADIFATIASTSNGLLIAVTQSVQHDLLRLTAKKRFITGPLITAIIGAITITLSVTLPGNVYSIIMSSISLLGAGLAGPVMIKIMHWRHTGLSLLSAIIGGIAGALLWQFYGLDSAVNQAGIGLLCSLIINYLLSRLPTPEH